MAVAANTRTTQVGGIVASSNAGNTRVTQVGAVIASRNAGNVRVTQVGMILALPVLAANTRTTQVGAIIACDISSIPLPSNMYQCPPDATTVIGDC